MQKITPCLWFDNNAEEAMDFYTAVFKDSSILSLSRFPSGRRQSTDSTALDISALKAPAFMNTAPPRDPGMPAAKARPAR